jgi:cell volume regulation protein A
MESLESALLFLSLLLLTSILATKLSGKLGIPVLLFFLGIGMLAGAEGPGKILFYEPKAVQNLGVIALIFILFSGGLDTVWRTSKPIAGRGLVLSTLGVLITSTLVGFFTSWVFHLSLLEGLLLGAAVSSTDATAVFTILRSNQVSLRGSLKPLLELESGSNDPMAVFLTVGLLKLYLDHSHSVISLIPTFFEQMFLGAIIGLATGRALVYLVNHSKLGFEGLYPVLSIALVLFSFAFSQMLGGNGFLAVYLAGIIAGNRKLIHKRNLLSFHEGLAWLMQIAMFFILGLQVSFQGLRSVAPDGLLLSCFLIFLARPMSVYFCLLGSQFSFAEKTLISWVGLRGAAPIILATYPLLAGVPSAPLLFNWVFFIVLTSILFQGTSIVRVSRWLKLEERGTPRTPFPIEFHPSRHLKSEILEFEISPQSRAVGKTILELRLPKKSLIVLIQRQNETFAPSGMTRLEIADRMIVLAEQSDVEKLRQLFESSLEKSA